MSMAALRIARLALRSSTQPRSVSQRVHPAGNAKRSCCGRHAKRQSQRIDAESSCCAACGCDQSVAVGVGETEASARGAIAARAKLQIRNACVQRLEHLILVEIPEAETGNQCIPAADAENIKNTSRYYDELVSLWRALALAAQEKRLAPADVKKVQGAVDAAAAKGVKCVPGADRCLWSWSQCADMQAAATAVAAAAAASSRADTVDESQAALSFHEAGLMLDVGVGNNGPLADVSEGIRMLLRPSAAASAAAAAAVVTWFSCNQPRAPSQLQLRCLSWGLWLVIKPKLARDAVQPLLPEATVAAVSAFLESTLPDLRVYCSSGPGIGSVAYAARWLNVFKDEAGDGVSPILLDEVPTNSGGLNSACQCMALFFDVARVVTLLRNIKSKSVKARPQTAATRLSLHLCVRNDERR
jgi:hypothetical protein